MSVTPRTDEAGLIYAKWKEPPVCGSFARQLERELAQCADVLTKCNKWIEDAKPLLERGGEAERALESLLKRYVDLVNCGDCGNWNPETEQEVVEARRVLKQKGENHVQGIK